MVSGRLIDADKLIEDIEEIARTDMMKVLVESWINEQPTAYNVDKVVEQLEEMFYCSDDCQKKFYQGLGCKACLFGKAIEIVKGNYCENGNSSEGGAE